VAFSTGASRVDFDGDGDLDLLSGSYGGHDMLEAHFGLGNAAVVDSLVIDWPSGLTQVLTNVAIRQRLVVTEDASTATVASLVSVSASPDRVSIEWQISDTNTVDIERRLVVRVWLDGGRHEVRVPAPDSLPAGFSWLRLSHPAGARSVRVTWLR